jgi:hypothetical protein
VEEAFTHVLLHPGFNLQGNFFDEVVELGFCTGFGELLVNLVVFGRVSRY